MVVSVEPAAAAANAKPPRTFFTRRAFFFGKLLLAASVIRAVAPIETGRIGIGGVSVIAGV